MYFIQTKNQIEGFHRWKDAPKPVQFLRDRHRHIFDIVCKKCVLDGDRSIEIISQQREIESFIKDRFGLPAEFGDLSCELIAEIICNNFNFDSVEVLEDGISGGGFSNV